MKKGNKLKLILSLSVATILVFLATFLALYFTLFSSDETGISMITRANDDLVSNDPTRIDLPDWAITLIQVGIWVVIGILAVGILILLVYIFYYFWSRKHGRFAVVIKEEQPEDESNQNLVRISLGEETVLDEKRN